ncbi:MAG: LamG domain-containing protein [bacterium]|nr:LamG domain-containing protein [bacterium]
MKSNVNLKRINLRSYTLGWIIGFLFVVIFNFPVAAQDKSPILSWDFSEINNRTTVEQQSGIADTLEGNFMTAPGIRGRGLKLDGFTTRLLHSDRNLNPPGNEITVEAWIALGNYPWNWCPVLTAENNETKGYRLMIGPHGEVSLQIAIGEQWISCTSERLSIPLRKWMHITGVYRANNDLAVYINGELKASVPINGKMTYARGSDCIIGMVAHPEKPSDIHRTWGTLPQYFGLNGIIDEIKVFYEAKTDGEIAADYAGYEVKTPDIMAHKLPDIEKNPGRFGAFYTKLKYYDGWDNLWPVEQDPDIVVCFDKLPVKVVFWRGIRYGTSWVSENNNWMTDQSVEAWGVGANDNEGCFEHMQDRHCRFSHVRIIENNAARVVVHWRYALVSAYNNTWRVDPKTGWECWIDEYHYIYPDAAGIRKVSWKKGSLKFPRQFQESLPLLHPGQVESDLLHKDFVHVADYSGNTEAVSYVDNPKPLDWNVSEDYTVQQYNFKSENKPFICYEPGNKMHLRENNITRYNDHGGCNHFPVGQARCDGRTSTTSDRPSHCSGFPISYPVVHEKGDRYFWNGLYGINGLKMKEIIELGKSWAFAPEIEINGNGFISHGYDKSERCYQLENNNTNANKLEFKLAGSNEKPICNPAFVIKNWIAEKAEVLVDGKPIKDARIGINHELEGNNLVIFLFLEKNEPVDITILPK